MDAAQLLESLCTTIDERRWDDLPALLHDDFECRYVHTGEELDGASWVRLNAEYPDFDRLTVEDLVSSGDRAVARCHVTGRTDTGVLHFEVASFITVRDDLVSDLTEVWTDVGQTAPPGARPA